MWTSFVGFNGSGKSAVTRVMGQGTLLPTVDLDREIACKARVTIPDIFQKGGVTAFRRWEGEVLGDLDRREPLLLATGAGCVETASHRDLLRERGVVLWLDAPWEVIRARLEQGGPGRWPMIEHLGWPGLESLYRRRLRLYAATAHFRLRSDVGDLQRLARHALLRRLLWRRRHVEATA